MTVDPTSRYAGVEVARRTVVDRDGGEHVLSYLRRRPIPDYTDRPVLAEYRVAEGDRLDLVAARYLGDPAQFWRLCDANVVLSPDELEQVGRLVRIALGER